MKIISVSFPPEPFRDGTPPIVAAIGDFDGVHLGHQIVIGQAVQIARETGCSPAVMTFDPHPREVLGYAKYSRYLAPLPKKLELFEQLGVDYTFVVRFDRIFSRISPEAFVDEMLQKLHIHTVVVGFDFTFGHKAKGTVETLRKLCRGKMNVKVVKPYNMHGDKVSSTLIREQLHFGRLERVKAYTGRDYFITGTVVHGDGRGRELGFPTANVRLNEPYVIPRNGVYAVRFICDGRTYCGVMNIGMRPTFQEDESGEPSLEVHVLDFDGDLYGKKVRIEFLKFIRPEEKFPDVHALVRQIEEDVEQARAAFR